MYGRNDAGGRVLYEDDRHRFIWLGADQEQPRGVVQTNQYLITDGGKGVLLDPGGVHLFARVVSAASRYIDLSQITSIVFSHQDPDVSSGIALWLGITGANIHVSRLWVRFLPHFGVVDQKRIREIEDHPRIVLPSGAGLRFVPSHFLHSAGTYSLYDELAKIIFTADIGTAVFPEGEERLFVENFAEHVPFMEPFHQRYMSGNRACRRWAKQVGALDIDMIAPQHGSVFRREASQQFLAWLEKLPCGVDLIDEFYSAGSGAAAFDPSVGGAVGAGGGR